jgi:hypothetical protein
MPRLHRQNYYDIERIIEFDFVRATEAAALNSLRWLGRGDKEKADEAACDAMRGMFDLMNICGEVVIGEGIKDDAPGILKGEQLGTWLPGTPPFDIAIGKSRISPSSRRSRSPARSACAPELCQGDGLEGADDVVRTFCGEEAFVKTGTEVPVVTFVIFVAVKAPDAAHDDEATNPVVPEIADVIEAQVRARVGAFESNVIVNHNLRQPDNLFRRFHFHLAGGGSVVAERAEFPFRVDDAAVVRRQFSFRYLSHKLERLLSRS